MIITKESPNKDLQRKIGGKGHNLYLLTGAGFPIPPWVIVGSDVFKKFLRTANLNQKIVKELQTIRANTDVENVKAASLRIQNLITSTPTPSAIEGEIRRAYRALGSSYVAIRSSGIEEDSRRYSYAGQFESYLGVQSESEALIMTKKCWASAFSERSLSYRIVNNMDFSVETIGMSVIFQEMIDGDKSGVLFTNDPSSNDSAKVVINSAYGLGAGIVNDTVETDQYVINKANHKDIERKIAGKNSSLNDAELSHLTELGVKIEAFYKYPQDIEWTIKGKDVYILQARPITTVTDTASGGSIRIWDNSNIVESYGGLTLPLTFTFARYVYHQVYVQFCEVLMVPQRNIQKMDYFLANMLGIFYGRIYYNLINWYRLTSILPGFRQNSSFMETMMGTRQSLEQEIADSIEPFQSKNKLYTIFLKVLIGCKFFYYHVVIQKKVDDFLRYFDTVYQEYRRVDYVSLDPDAILIKFREVELKLLHSWKAPIINDFLCMVHFGMLKKLSNKWLPEFDSSTHNDLLCGQGNIESMAPTQQLISMANVARADKKLKRLLLRTPAKKCMEVIGQPEFSSFKTILDHYIDQYGFRCMNEMKLEQKDLHQDPTFVFVCLKNYLHEERLDFTEYAEREREIRESAERKVTDHLHGIKKIVYFWSLKNARRAIRNRESTRFCRTKIYGVVRSMFYNIGRRYTKHSIIEAPEDIFYLELNELLGTVDGTLTTQDLKSIISLRKNEYKRFAALELPNRFTTRGAAYWHNEYVDSGTHTNGPISQKISGIACSPGIVEGIVKVISSPDSQTQLNGEILVTPRTDPGWIPLYPSISGLLVERGSLLSHSAIVAREMGIPTIVGIPNLIKNIRSGTKVRMDGKKGTIQIMDS